MRRREIDLILDLRLLWILELIMSNWQRGASFDFWGVVARKSRIVYTVFSKLLETFGLQKLKQFKTDSMFFL